MVKVNEKQSKNFTHPKSTLYLSIYKLLKQGKKPSHKGEDGKERNSICSALNISKQRLNHYLSSLKKAKIIRKHYSVWEILQDLDDKQLIGEINKIFKSKSQFSIGLKKPTTNLHALNINIPIIKGKILDSDWKIKNKLKNWIPKYTELKDLGGLTIRNNNNKSITIFVKTRDIESLNEVDNLAFKVKSWIFSYFKNKHGVILDVMNAETKNLNLATQDENSEDMIRKGEVFELDLNKKAEKIFPKDKIDGKAWIDGSPFKFSAETNDKEWKREYLSMPFKMRDTLQAVHYIAQNYASHVKIVEQAGRIMEKLDKRLSIRKRKTGFIEDKQTKLNDYFSHN